MTGFSNKGLDRLQLEILQAFASREPGFVLSGGAALVGFHLRHRETKDLDFFCANLDTDLQLIGLSLEDVVRTLGGDAELLQSYPRFRRYQVVRGEESTIVDLVLDATPRSEPPSRIGAVLVDTMAEIAANKICTLIGRAEIRDLVDLITMLETGIDLETTLAAAQKKEGGIDPATLAWVLDELYISHDAQLPGEMDAGKVDLKRREIVTHLRRLAFPDQDKR